MRPATQLAMSRRELGSVYTPLAVAGRMARACLDRLFGGQGSPQDRAASPSRRVLDPACGDGAFLLEVFDELCRRNDFRTGVDDALGDQCDPLETSSRRLAIVRDHIFGVDIDPPAVDALRKTLLERIAAKDELVDRALAVIEANIRHGDSLAGPDFATLPVAEPKACHASLWPELERSEAPAIRPGGIDPIDWRRAFPAAAAAGGFDVIIGNPPYVRERNAKPLFDALAATQLGRRWREARMDLWYYFVHRSLDLLRPGGILSFIVNSYWMSSRGAGKLIERLRRDTSFEEIILLENARVFQHVAGRHMIFRLRKNGVAAAREPGMPGSIAAQSLSDPPLANGSAMIALPAVCRVVTASAEYAVSHDELFQPGRLVVARPDPGQAVFQNRITLGRWHDTRQGMAENPPVINRRLHREFGGRYPFGMGVFVLQSYEVERLNLCAAELALLRPYYDTSAVGRYRITDEPTHQVLYLSRATAPSLEGLTNIASHLERFRPILERRREVQAEKIRWWHLHWPRDEQIFVEPRILSVQMGKRPQFVFAARPTFVGFSINLILTKSEGAFALDVLCGILNSNLALTWFDRHAKRRGVNLEINAHLLRQFPLPGCDAEIERMIGELVRERQSVQAQSSQAVMLEKEIEEFVARLYAIRAD
jgi:SAM-dependent methyltransferase